MTAETEILQPAQVPAEKAKAPASTFSRVAKYAAIRAVILFLTVSFAIYLTILIANMGGYVDNIRKGEIQESVALNIQSNPATRNLPADARNKLMTDQIASEYKRVGLDQPFLVRSFLFWKGALTLDLGRSIYMNSASGSRQVRLIILERLPTTLLLFGTADLILFFSAVFIALFLSRRYGSILDKLMIALVPTSSAPGWFYGIFFILIFAALLRWLPFGGMIDAPPPDGFFPYLLSLLKHMILPVAAFTFATMFYQSYNWRTFFLIYSSEDYVDMAKAKGLTSRDIERRYILRPTLPTIITSFALLMIGVWTGAPIFETIFNWPGLGRTFYQAIQLFDTPVIVGETIIFAYMLAITVFLLDFVYALVDPRVKIGGSQGSSA